MKAWLRTTLEGAAVIVVVPQVFVLLYHFRLLLTGGNALGLWRDLSLYGLTVSWVSAPALAALFLAVKVLLRGAVRWRLTLLVCLAGGFAWVAAWNALVYPGSFAYGRAALPVLLCSLGVAGYAAARALYVESLKPQPPFRSEPGEPPAA